MTHLGSLLQLASFITAALTIGVAFGVVAGGLALTVALFVAGTLISKARQ